MGAFGFERGEGLTEAAYGDWLTIQGPAFMAGIRTATLDPFHGYTNAIRDELPRRSPSGTRSTS